MYQVSDSSPNEEDIRKHVEFLKTKRSKILMRRTAAQIRRKQDALVNNYTYTKEDIEQNLRERKKTGKTATNLGLEQTRMDIAVEGAKSALDDAKRQLEDARHQLNIASQSGDAKEQDSMEKAVMAAETMVEDAKQDLKDRMEERREVMSIVKDRKRKLTTRRNDNNWAKVNQRAVKMNQGADFQSYKEQQARKEAEAKGGAPKFNPYARRKVKPKILWEVGQKEEKKDDEAAQVNERDAAIEKELEEQARRDREKAAKAAQEAKKAAGVNQSHQFTLDADDLAHDSLSFGLGAKKRKITRVRKGLSLADYQKQKTAGVV